MLNFTYLVKDDVQSFVHNHRLNIDRVIRTPVQRERVLYHPESICFPLITQVLNG